MRSPKRNPGVSVLWIWLNTPPPLCAAQTRAPTTLNLCSPTHCMSTPSKYKPPRYAFTKTELQQLYFVDLAQSPSPLACRSNARPHHLKSMFPHPSYIPPIKLLGPPRCTFTEIEPQRLCFYFILFFVELSICTPHFRFFDHLWLYPCYLLLPSFCYITYHCLSILCLAPHPHFRFFNPIYGRFFKVNFHYIPCIHAYTLR